jgi:hypothetical protein
MNEVVTTRAVNEAVEGSGTNAPADDGERGGWSLGKDNRMSFRVPGQKRWGSGVAAASGGDGAGAAKSVAGETSEVEVANEGGERSRGCRGDDGLQMGRNEWKGWRRVSGLHRSLQVNENLAGNEKRRPVVTWIACVEGGAS